MMKTKLFLAILALFISYACGNSNATKEIETTLAQSPLAQSPPLGWNSFDSYGVYLHEEAAMANVEAFAQKLKPHGYEFFVIDAGWFGEFELQPGTIYPAEKHAKK